MSVFPISREVEENLALFAFRLTEYCGYSDMYDDPRQTVCMVIQIPDFILEGIITHQDLLAHTTLNGLYAVSFTDKGE